MDKSTKKDKNAFTFAELMISLIVISVLSAILYPTIAQFTPNSNKPLFKSAYKSLSTVLSEIIEDQRTGELPIADDAVGNTPATQLCLLFCEKANIAHTKTAANTYASTCTDECATIAYSNKPANTLTTSNGMRWRFNDYASYTNPSPQDGTVTREANITDETGSSINTFQIFVDVNSSNNKLSQVGGLDAIQTHGAANDTPIRQLFVTNCTDDRNGGCGVFYFDNTVGGRIVDNREVAIPGTNGIYITTPNFNVAIGVTPRQPVYFRERLKTQDTFEILIDKKGKIVAMSPAAWGNLEDREGD